MDCLSTYEYWLNSVRCTINVVPCFCFLLLIEEIMVLHVIWLTSMKLLEYYVLFLNIINSTLSC